jgi:hypothetical protein
MKKRLRGIVKTTTLVCGSPMWSSRLRSIDGRDIRSYEFEDTHEQMPYALYVSSKVKPNKKSPLIVTLHGLGGTHTTMMRSNALDLAEAGGYILVAPMGYNPRGWYGVPSGTSFYRRPPGSAPRPSRPPPPPNNDPPNLRELSEKDVLNVIALIQKEFKVDERRIYLMGHSRCLDPFIGELALKHVHMGSLQTFITRRRSDGVKTKTINCALGVVRRVLNLAASEWIDERGMTWLERAPKIKLFPVIDARPPYPLSTDEQALLFQEVPEHLARIALFKVNSGCREQEVCGLKWELANPIAAANKVCGTESRTSPATTWLRRRGNVVPIRKPL